MGKRVLVCLDGSKLAESILPCIIDEAICSHHELILLRAIPRPVIDNPPDPNDPMENESLVVEARKEYSDAKSYLEEVANRLRGRGVKTSTVIVGEKAGESIVSYAEGHNIDLIAMATHGYAGLKRVLIGSVASYVLKESGIPALIFKPKQIPETPLDIIHPNNTK
jgi:nucleotide-binding universal stress UspA family protein